MANKLDMIGVDMRFRLPKESDASDRGLVWWRRSGVWMVGDWKDTPVDATHWAPHESAMKTLQSGIRLVSCAKCGSSHADGGLTIPGVILRDGVTGEALDKVCPNCVIYALVSSGTSFELKLTEV